MATLVFTAVGQALGGPFGAALGSLLGRTVDEQFFGSGPRKGPRLGDLSVQTSSYGSMVPRIYGSMRVAGTVIWATDLVEEESYEATGKWAPGVVRYRYSANLAVALSSRPVRNVGRIWADGKLIRGVAGDWKVDCTFRLMTGGEDQAVDPLVASEEGMALAPAFRGMAVAVFERLDLSSFGNRIPMLTFEVVADDGAVEVVDLLDDASGGVIGGASSGQAVAGYAAHGGGIGDAVAPLIEAFGLALRDEGDRIIVGGADSVVPLYTDELGCSADGKSYPAIEWDRDGENELPSGISVQFYDAAREWQAGQVRVAAGGDGRRSEQVELPAVLTPDGAKTLGAAMLARRWGRGEQMTLRLPPSRIGLGPGDVVEVPGRGRWAVEASEVDGLALVVEARRADAAVPVLTADGGRAVRSVDEVVTRTVLGLFEVPQADGRSALSVAASSPGGFGAVSVEMRVGGGLIASAAVSRKARLGVLAAPMAADATSLDVLLVDADQWLLGADAAAIAAGANRAMIGHEMIQFASAEALGGGAWRLGGLVRGVRATGWAVGDHLAGTGFCLVDGAAMVPVPVDEALVGQTIVATAFGLADAEPLPSASLTYVGQSMSGMAPVEVTAPSGGNVVDGEARSTIDAILAVLNANGMTT
nr:phage tail protein [uncultured Sphingomonas sp.]